MSFKQGTVLLFGKASKQHSSLGVVYRGTNVTSEYGPVCADLSARFPQELGDAVVEEGV